MNPLRVAILGATGAVGQEMWRLLEASDLGVSGLLPYTSARSAGTSLRFRGEGVACRELGEDTFEPVDLVLASAGAAVAREWAPRFVKAGAVVIDNSSAFRNDPSSPLLVPEVNPDALGNDASLIANPNCSTIQMVVALAPLHREWSLRGVRVSTYQSVSGAGNRAVHELLRGSRTYLDGGEEAPEVFPHPIAFNLIPQIGSFDGEGESEEERKMRKETRRILDLPDLPVSATCVRVPVVRSHCESVWATFAERPDPERGRVLLADSGIVVGEPGMASTYSTPRGSGGRPEVFVGRLRRDGVDPHGLAFWVVSDNLLKGAALNAWQIVELLRSRGALVGRTQ